MKISQILVLLISLIFSIHLFGQHRDCGYDDYLYLTDRANVEWREGNKEAAFAHFKKALSLPVFPRGKHVANALQIAVELQDEKWAEKLAFKLIKAGVPMVYF